MHTSTPPAPPCALTLRDLNERPVQMFADAARTKRYTLNLDQSLQTLDNAEELTHKLVDPTKVQL